MRCVYYNGQLGWIDAKKRHKRVVDEIVYDRCLYYTLLCGKCSAVDIYFNIVQFDFSQSVFELKADYVLQSLVPYTMKKRFVPKADLVNPVSGVGPIS